jgi:hypothetical protein
MHWHSHSAIIRDEILAPDDPLRDEALYRDRVGAEKLELFIRAGIVRWNKARFDKRIIGGELTRASEFFRQVLSTTTVNLATSPQESRALELGDSVLLPRTFFLHSDALLSTLKLGIAFPTPKANAAHYLKCLQRYEVAVRDEHFSFPGDTHFAFQTSEPAFEDLVVLQELLARDVLSRKGAAALLMVDFPNPIFSPRRAKLLTYVPDRLALGAGAGFEQLFLPAVRAAAAGFPPEAPEQAFLSIWDLPDSEWESAVVERVHVYVAAIAEKIQTADGFDGFFRLAESRRREFRRRLSRNSDSRHRALIFPKMRRCWR